jgi:ketosteroid isomerase-like protein
MKRLLSIAALSVLAACSSSKPMSSDFSPGDAENAIRRNNSDFDAAVRAGNAQSAVDNFYAPDAIMMSPNMAALNGRDAVRGYWSQAASAGAIDLALTSSDVMQSCSDMAVESGRYDFNLTPKGGQAMHDTGKYIVVWKKMNGRWWAVRDIYNSDMAAK